MGRRVVNFSFRGEYNTPNFYQPLDQDTLIYVHTKTNLHGIITAYFVDNNENISMQSQQLICYSVFTIGFKVRTLSTSHTDENFTKYEKLVYLLFYEIALYKWYNMIC